VTQRSSEFGLEGRSASQRASGVTWPCAPTWTPSSVPRARSGRRRDIVSRGRYVQPPRLHPHLRHAFATVELDVFNLDASNREDQCVTPKLFGGVRRVAAMIASRSTVRGRPERGSSTRPSIPACSYLLRHNVTVGRDTPTREAISVFDTPSAASNTILARCANPTRIDVERTHDDNTCRSPSRTTNRAPCVPFYCGQSWSIAESGFLRAWASLVRRQPSRRGVGVAGKGRPVVAAPRDRGGVPWSQSTHVLRCQAATCWASSFQVTASS